MPRLPDVILNSVVYLYPSAEAAERGDPHGGTAFIVAVLDPGASAGCLYLVTCWHVLAQGATWVRMNADPNHPTATGTIIENIPIGDWTSSPRHDLAAVPIQEKYRVPAINVEPILMDMGLRPDECTPRGVGIGSDVFVVGRFVPADGKATNAPSARFGSISAMPGQEITYSYGKPKTYLKEVGFLVETRMIGGYSGSPAWTYYDLPFTPDTRFLGVVCAHLRHKIKDEDTGETHLSHSGMALVIPAWEVEEFMNTPELTSARAKFTEQIPEPEEGGDAVPDSVAADDDEMTREGFMDALKKVSRPDEAEGEE